MAYHEDSKLLAVVTISIVTVITAWLWAHTQEHLELGKLGQLSGYHWSLKGLSGRNRRPDT